MIKFEDLVRVEGKVWATPEIAVQARLCEKQKIPCAYSLWIGRDRDWGTVLETKDGQASTGDVIARSKARAGESLSRVVLLDIIEDPFFIKDKADQELNEFRAKNEAGVYLVREKDVSTKELIRYDTWDDFVEGPIRKREALAEITKNPSAGTKVTKLHTTQFRFVATAWKLWGEKAALSILANLCARFGKTLWAGALSYVLKEFQVVVVNSYVPTSFHSFRSQWAKSRQLKEEFIQINTNDKDWKENLDNAVSQGKRVVLFLSLCPGNNRQDRIDYIGSLNLKRIWITDEGDLGAHTEKQVNALDSGIKKEDLFIIMTGTNPDRAVSNWSSKRSFTPVSVVYEELILQKYETKKNNFYSLDDEFEKKLAEFFEIDPSLDLSIPDQVRIIQDLIGLVKKHKAHYENQVVDGEWDPKEFLKLPTFRKMSQHPNKAKPTWIDYFKSTVGGLEGFEHLNLDLFIDEQGLPDRTKYKCEITGNEILVEQYFCSATNSNLNKIADAAREGRPSWFVQATHGGSGFSNETYEKKIEKLMKECAERGQNLLIISNHQGQRSYSNGFQSTVSLSYDGGDWGTTIQKEARGLSMNEGDFNKFGITLIPSFNPNRDIKPYLGAITAVKNLGPKYPKMSAKDLLKYILPSLNIFAQGADGQYFQIDADKTVEKLYNNGLIKQVLGATQNISILDNESRKAWLDATRHKPKIDKEETGDDGETFSDDKPKSKKSSNLLPDTQKIEKEENAKIRAAMTLLFEKFHLFQIATGCRTVEEILKVVENDNDHRSAFRESFNIDIKILLKDIKSGAINPRSLEMSLT
jgi:hypothetical protein